AFDEAYLFRQSGEAPENPCVERLLQALAWLMSLFLMTMLAAGQILRGHFLGRSAMLHEIPAEWLIGAWLVLVTATFLSAFVTCWLARGVHGSLRQTVVLYQPLLAIYAGLIVILLLGSLFGSVGANLVIMLHGMTWLVQTLRKLRERNEPSTGLWSWL